MSVLTILDMGDCAVRPVRVDRVYRRGGLTAIETWSAGEIVSRPADGPVSSATPMAAFVVIAACSARVVFIWASFFI